MKPCWPHTVGHCTYEMTADPACTTGKASSIRTISIKGDNHVCSP